MVSGAGVQSLAFAGGLADASTGLVRCGARDYEASDALGCLVSQEGNDVLILARPFDSLDAVLPLLLKESR